MCSKIAQTNWKGLLFSKIPKDSHLYSVFFSVNNSKAVIESDG